MFRVTIVEAKHLKPPPGHPSRPYVTCRVGKQYGQTKLAGGFSFTGERHDLPGSACTWNQSFDFKLHRSER